MLLSEAYMHHWFVKGYRNDSGHVATFGAGSEFRHVPEELAAPFRVVLDGTERWYAQLHIIDLRTLHKEDRLPCLECRRRRSCDAGSCIRPDIAQNWSYAGGIYACNWSERGATAGSSVCAPAAPSALPRQYRLKYEVTYDVQQKRRRGAKPRFPSG